MSHEQTKDIRNIENYSGIAHEGRMDERVRFPQVDEVGPSEKRVQVAVFEANPGRNEHQ